MNCEHLNLITGMDCEPVSMRDGAKAISVLTPFTYFDGDGMEIFATSFDGQVHLFDDGLTMHWLHSIGLRMGQDRRRWAPLRIIAQAYGVGLSNDGTLETIASMEHASSAFARIVSAQIAIDAWAREHIGLPLESQWLIDEALMYLRAWRPDASVQMDPEPVVGFSGKTYSFQLALGQELIDTIAPHPNATGATLRKLVDLRNAPRNADLAIRVILDDRKQPEIAAQEASILGTLATTWTMTRLMAAAGVPEQAH